MHLYALRHRYVTMSHSPKRADDFPGTLEEVPELDRAVSLNTKEIFFTDTN